MKTFFLTFLLLSLAFVFGCFAAEHFLVINQEAVITATGDNYYICRLNSKVQIIAKSDIPHLVGEHVIITGHNKWYYTIK